MTVWWSCHDSATLPISICQEPENCSLSWFPARPCRSPNQTQSQARKKPTRQAPERQRLLQDIAFTQQISYLTWRILEVKKVTLFIAVSPTWSRCLICTDLSKHERQLTLDDWMTLGISISISGLWIHKCWVLHSLWSQSVGQASQWPCSQQVPMPLASLAQNSLGRSLHHAWHRPAGYCWWDSIHVYSN